jgi:release factor glutamine methyltransferase
MRAENYQDFVNRLLAVFEPGEAQAIARVCCEELTGQKGLQAISAHWSELQTQEASAWLHRLLQGEPLQYVLGKAWFYGLELRVGPGVLIPRPETEELVDWILQEEPQEKCRLIDFGTGSGCIPRAIFSKRPGWKIWGLDVEEAALGIARSHAGEQANPITWILQDMADRTLPLPEAEIWVSNPPYIADSEKKAMEKQVLDFEPHTALFVPDGNDVLFFYRCLAERAVDELPSGGRIYLELNPLEADAIAGLFRTAHFSTVEIRVDLSGKERMLRAVRA